MIQDVNVFISHRYADAEIADVINKHLQLWGVPAGSIFQSSRAHQGLTPGESVTQHLISRLTRVNLLVLVYTFAEEDWSNCMWECGIATGKSSAETRIVVFQCTQDVPKVFQDQVRVTVSREGIRSFVGSFHRKRKFIPGVMGEDQQPKALSPSTTDQILESKSEQLFKELDDAVPGGTMSSAHLWDFLRLRISGNCVETISKVTREDALSLVAPNTELLRPVHVGVDSTIGTALRQFGYQAFEDGLTLEKLFQRWKIEDQTGAAGWIAELQTAIFNAVTNRSSNPISKCFKSVRTSTNWRFIPVVTRVRGMPDNSKEFDVYLIRVEPEKMQEM